jgi:hypothetical protein
MTMIPCSIMVQVHTAVPGAAEGPQSDAEAQEPEAHDHSRLVGGRQLARPFLRRCMCKYVGVGGVGGPVLRCVSEYEGHVLVVATRRAGTATDATSAPSCVRFLLSAHISLRACVCCVRCASSLLFVLCTQMHAQGQGELLQLPDVRVSTKAVRRWRNARDGFFRTRNGSRTCPCSDGVCTREDHAWRRVTGGGLAGVILSIDTTIGSRTS